MKKVGVVILNWNGKTHLETYMPSVIDNSGGATIVVVDNASTDDSVSFLESDYPTVRLIHNKENGGFAKGYNDGLEQIKGEFDFYILLNSDVEVTPNWISTIIELMNTDDLITACQPKILSYNQKNKFEHAGAAGGYIDKNGYPFCRGRIFNEIEEDKGQYNSVEEVFWATGACMFVRSEVFHNLGGFDEDYFAHMEEIDLCWRMKLHGYKVLANPESVVYHLGGGTLNYLSPRKVFLNFRNSLFTLYKNYRGNFLFFKIIWRFCLDYIAAVKFVIDGSFGAAGQIFKSQFHFLKNLGKLRIKRRKLKFITKKYSFNNTGFYSKSIVFSSYIKRKTKYSDLKTNNFKH